MKMVFPITTGYPRPTSIQEKSSWNFARIDRAYAMGIRPTHLDSHQYRLFDNGKELFEVVVRIAHDYQLPVSVAHDWFTDRPCLQSGLGPAGMVINHTVTIVPSVRPSGPISAAWP
jgi:hypothetical protein